MGKRGPGAFGPSELPVRIYDGYFGRVGSCKKCGGGVGPLKVDLASI